MTQSFRASGGQERGGICNYLQISICEQRTLQQGHVCGRDEGVERPLLRGLGYLPRLLRLMLHRDMAELSPLTTVRGVEPSEDMRVDSTGTYTMEVVMIDPNAEPTQS